MKIGRSEYELVTYVITFLSAVFTFYYTHECYTFVMTFEYADFQLLYIAVALNALIYFHSYVLYFGYILVLLSGITDPIGVLTYGQEDETLHFCL